MSDQIKSIVSEISFGLDEFRRNHSAALDRQDKKIAGVLDRVEKIDSLGDRPAAGANKCAPKPYREFVSDDRTVYVVPGNAKLADFPAYTPREQPEISLDRWTRALVRRC
jgi:hypothetical protein